MATTIPEIINNFNCYQDGNRLIGVTDEVTLPDFEAMSETISGAGLLGEREATNPGHFGSQEVEVPFRVMYGDIYSLIDPTSSVDLTLRGSIQTVDGSGNKKWVGMRVIMRGDTKKITGGSMKPGSPMSSSVTLELSYIKIEVDGSSKVEVDKINGVYKIAGSDVLATINSLC